MRAFVTGCAGFIGSNLVNRLLTDGHSVTGFDNFSTGRREFLDQAMGASQFQLVEGNTLDQDKLASAMRGVDTVFHLAANADVRFGLEHPAKDLEQNTIATFNVLESMRTNGIRTIVFSSTGSVYGEPDVFPTPESCPFPVQTSLYGASKLAGEGLISAYAHGFGFQGLIFRFVSILGPRYTHGHVYDFFNKLRDDPRCIEVLGNGQQRKSYLHVSDCIDAILLALAQPSAPVSIYNLGTDEFCTVDQSLGWICSELGLSPQRQYTGGERGWAGDSPFIFLDTSRIKALGWQSKHTIQASVVETLRYLREHPALLQPQ